MFLPGSGTWTLDHQLVVPFDLAGGSTSLEMGLVGGFVAPPHFQFSSPALCLWLRLGALSFWFLPEPAIAAILSHHDGLFAIWKPLPR